MKKNEIPAIDLVQIHKRGFGFQIANNREILLKENLGYNPYRPHRIRFYAVLFIQEGSGVHFVDFKKYTYKRGSVIFISKEQVHAFEMNMERKALFLLFTEEFMEKGNLGSNLMHQLSLYNYHLFPPVINLKEEEIVIFSELVERIKEEFDTTDDLLTEEIIHSSLKIFLCLAERIRKKKQKQNPRSRYLEEFLQFQKLLSQKIHETRKVKTYADELFISSKKLNRITQEINGKAAKRYINEFFVTEIKRLLMNPSFSIKEVAHQSGFEETTNFVKYFKKQVGVNPTEFRKQF